jgi:hypothetical protein
MDDDNPLQKLEREPDHHFTTRKDANAIFFSRSSSTGGGSGFASSNVEGIYPEWVFPQLARRGYHVRTRGNTRYVESIGSVRCQPTQRSLDQSIPQDEWLTYDEAHAQSGLKKRMLQNLVRSGALVSKLEKRNEKGRRLISAKSLRSYRSQ